MKKHIKAIIAIVIIIIICLVVTLIVLNRKEEKKLYEEKNDVNRATYVPRIDEEVKIPSVYYTIENIMKKYFTYVYLNYNEQEQMDPNVKVGTLAENYNIFNKEDKEEALIKLLDFNYIEENEIDKNNVKNFIEINEKGMEKCEAKEMIEREAKTIKTYGVRMEVQQEDEKKDGFYIVTLDFANKTFMVKPMVNCKSINDIDLSFVEEVSEIPKKEINTFTSYTMDEGKMAQRYFEDFKENLIENPEEAYEKLSEEYREKRFGSYEKFAEFLEKNKEEINEIRPTKYLVNDIDGNLQYVCKDIYNNDYIFDTTGVMKYTVKLDTYTIMSDNFKSTYEKAKGEEKVSMNIQKWIQMLNSRDYDAAYDVLDDNFKARNFGTVEEFEDYIKNKCPQHYQIVEGTTNEENGLYTSQISIQSVTEEGNTSYITIIMKLKEDKDFVMSFSFE